MSKVSRKLGNLPNFTKLEEVDPYFKSFLSIAKTVIFNQHTRDKELLFC